MAKYPKKRSDYLCKTTVKIGKNEQDLIVAIVGRRVIGCVNVRHQNRRVALIANLFVEEFNRKAGWGRVLVSYACSVAKAAGCESVALDIDAGNEGVEGFYKKLGFVRGHDYGGEGGSIFIKSLESRDLD